MYEELWRELEQARGDGVGRVERRLESAGHCDVFLAVSKPANARILTIASRGAVDPTPLRTPEVRGFDVLVVSEADVTTVEVRLSEPRFSGLFTVLIQDLIAVVNLSEPDSAVVSLVSRVDRWQRFLAIAGLEGLNRQRARGLFGELWFMREHLIGPLGPRPACTAWTGPLETHQDFQLPRCAVEVKTTRTTQPQKMRITSERQLDDTGVERLFLFYLSLDTRRGGGETLPALIDELRGVFGDGECREQFEEKLFRSGYSDMHRARYENEGYTRRDSAIFTVRDDFPRIVEQGLRPGVGDVHYSVGVTACRDHVISPGSFRSVIMETSHE